MNTMNAPAKFLFEDDFAVNAKPAKPMVSLAAHQSALARAEEDGYRKGVAAAEACPGGCPLFRDPGDIRLRSSTIRCGAVRRSAAAPRTSAIAIVVST